MGFARFSSARFTAVPLVPALPPAPVACPCFQGAGFSGCKAANLNVVSVTPTLGAPVDKSNQSQRGIGITPAWYQSHLNVVSESLGFCEVRIQSIKTRSYENLPDPVTNK